MLKGFVPCLKNKRDCHQFESLWLGNYIKGFFFFDKNLNSFINPNGNLFCNSVYSTSQLYLAQMTSTHIRIELTTCFPLLTVEAFSVREKKLHRVTEPSVFQTAAC